MARLTVEERKALKEKYDSKINYFLTNLKNTSSVMFIKENEDVFYIISPSTYYQGQYQMTTFNRNDSYTNKLEATSHTEEKTISDLIMNNIGKLINYTIAEAS